MKTETEESEEFEEFETLEPDNVDSTPLEELIDYEFLHAILIALLGLCIVVGTAVLTAYAVIS